MKNLRQPIGSRPANVRLPLGVRDYDKKEYRMSAGPFLKARYRASYGSADQIHPIRVQPETVTCDIGGTTNDLPGQAINNPISAVVSRGRSQRGLKCRTVTLRTPISSPPTGYLPGGFITIPCLTQAFFDAAADADDTTTVTYLNTSGFSVSFVSDEKVN